MNSNKSFPIHIEMNQGIDSSQQPPLLAPMPYITSFSYFCPSRQNNLPYQYVNGRMVLYRCIMTLSSHDLLLRLDRRVYSIIPLAYVNIDLLSVSFQISVL
jgi:hypothetical protein